MGGACLAQLVKFVTLNLGLMSLSPNTRCRAYLKINKCLLLCLVLKNKMFRDVWVAQSANCLPQVHDPRVLESRLALGSLFSKESVSPFPSDSFPLLAFSLILS